MSYTSRDDVSGLTSAMKNNLCAQLWHACSGSVYIPNIGEKVFYFPQGHLEQVAIFQHQQDHNMENPNYHLSSKILCIVMGVQLKAKVDTDEIFALVTLFPLPEQQEIILEDNHAIQSPSELYSFSQILTSSEISTLGGLYISKEHAERCFPPLDMTLESPMHDLVGKDLHENEWNFRHIYCSYQKEHMLTNGWSTFVNSKNLAPGDSCIFVRGENGEFGIGIRRDMKQHTNVCCTTSSQQFRQNMQLPPLVAAHHAVSTGTLFHVQYYPWITPFEYMVPLKTYVESTEKDYSIGTRVQMLSQGCTKRYGTIVGNEDIDPINWPASDWRSLKVQWDSIPNTFTHLERVCPWWIEPLKYSKIKGIHILPLSKKIDEYDSLLFGLSGFGLKDTFGSSSKLEYHKVDMDLQGQDYSIKKHKKSKILNFAFCIFICFFIFVIAFLRPLM
ncbi:auxin response factor 4 [Lathyrus oleraceus]|uniref:Auxin response factor n=1 Tax=Pisum sativum TaxID=3888 RepID=A0A9D5ATA8_PEA|nr:auxin response factor 4-like [Pisum sativum]KAI5420968.1 hypothetical protein KIW84_044714 [Pisum sativum]